jgi:uncharacterized protein DUF4238
MTIAKVQHYVPQFLLRNFGNGKKDQMWVYDKTSDRAFPTNAKNVASESRFYDFEVDGEPITLEPFLSKLEGQAKAVIDSILDADSLTGVTDEGRAVMAAFLSVQLTRTRTFREEWNAFPRMLREHFEKAGDEVAPGSQAEQLLRDSTENESKQQTGRIMIEAPQTYGQFFLSKHPFILSDNPLTRQNLNDLSPRGNLGLKTAGIEIYLPLSPTRALAMWCTTLTELVHRGAISIMSNAARMASDAANDPEGILALSQAITTGRPVNYSKQNVENFNSLQVGWSERYVFSSVNDFHLVKEMLQSEPKLKSGPRSVVA